MSSYILHCFYRLCDFKIVNNSKKNVDKISKTVGKCISDTKNVLEIIMIFGCPKDIKKCEYRGGLTPPCFKAYVRQGHTVLVEKGAGAGSGIEDNEYQEAGAKLVSAAEALNLEYVPAAEVL